jgi:hypothetical protein
METLLKLIAVKLNRSTDTYLNVFPSLVIKDVWREKFIAYYGFSLKKGANYDLACKVINRDYNILLKYAIKGAHNDLVKYLWFRDKKNNKFLIYASLYGNYGLVELLLDREVDINTNNDEALRSAAQYGHLKVVRLLLDGGADIHAKNDKTLRSAAYNGYMKIVKLLLDRGADIDAKRWLSLTICH